MNKFQYYRAASVQDAVTALSSHAGSRIHAGGLDLLGELKQHLIEPDVLVSISRIQELKTIDAADDLVTIGALTTLCDIAHHETIRQRFPALAQAAASVGSPQIRHVGTIGGNLCQRPRCWYYRDDFIQCLKKGGNLCYAVAGKNQYHAIIGSGPCFMVHPSDCAPALIALDAQTRIAGPDGEREIPLEDFYILPSEDATREFMLQPSEIITHVMIPSNNYKSMYIKFREKDSFDWALVSIALAVKMNGTTCEKANVILSGVAPKPWRSEAAQSILEGNPLTEDTAMQAAEAAVEDASPLAENRGKIQLTKALIQKAVLNVESEPTKVNNYMIY